MLMKGGETSGMNVTGKQNNMITIVCEAGETLTIVGDQTDTKATIYCKEPSVINCYRKVTAEPLLIEVN